ncbi:MAG: hypothetical protein QOJ84_3198 [Bradyrhizobium sp.]|jgi:WD40 repeat protein|nr:hypothetical protein [Bradyrhizobium sp.]
MSRIFLSHSSKNNDSAVALRDWLAEQGWNDVFLDLDPKRGIAAGDRWERSLNQAALRCEAVLFLVSRAWLSSDWCLKEFHLAHRLNKRLFGLLIEDISISDLPATLTGAWQLVPLASGRDHVMVRAFLPGSQDEVHVTFSQEGLTRLRIGLERAGLDARFFAWPPETDPNRPPYRGLRPLETADAGIFFGREAPTIEALDRIRGMKDAAAPRMLVLLGASGAGKSSFLRAGLLPRLARDDRNYLALPVIRPERAAITGEGGLLRSLEAVLVMHGVRMPRADIRLAIEGGAATVRPLLQTLIARVRNALVADDAQATAPVLVLAIDQGEELFLTEGASESTALLNVLRELLADDAPAVLVVITIRSDAYEQLQTAKALEGITQQPLSLIPMPRGAYHAVIEGPVVRLKETDRPLSIAPALTQALLSDIEEGGGRDALPLLAFTLERLYLEYGARGRLTLKDYDALGRIKGSIEAAVERGFRAADNVVHIPRDHDARLALLRRGLIPWLAGIDPDTGTARRQKARISEIPEEARPLIDLLVEQRLLSTDVSEDTGERTIEPAHESLLRQWGSLQGWLQEDFAALTTLETVKRSARDWAANAKSDDWLAHRAGRLEDAERLLDRTDLAGKLDTTDRIYLGTCRQRDETERKEKSEALERRLRLLRRLGVAAGLVAALMSLLGVLAYRSGQTANTERNQALISQSRFLAQQANLNVDEDDATTAELLAIEALSPDDSGRARPLIREADEALRHAVERARELLVLHGHYGEIFAVDFSRDGHRILTASADRTSRIWDAETGRQLGVLSGHSGSVLNAVFSVDGGKVLTCSDDGSAIVWNVETGGKIKALDAHSGAVVSGAFGPDETIITINRNGVVRRWDIASGTASTPFQTAPATVASAAFSSGGKQIVFTDGGFTAQINDYSGNTPPKILEGHTEPILSTAFSADGTRVVTTSADRTARVWDSSSGRQLVVFEGHQGAVTSAAFSIDGNQLVTTSEDKTIRTWGSQTGNRTGILKGHDAAISRAIFSPDGQLVASSSKDGTARVWKSSLAGKDMVLAGHLKPIFNVNYNLDGTRVATASGDGTVRLWNTISGLLDRKFEGHLGRVYSVAFSHDGHRLLTASADGTARIWDVRTGISALVLRGHDADVFSAAFSPDDTLVVTSSSDGTAKVWDSKTGLMVSDLNPDGDSSSRAAVRKATFTSRGDVVVAASEDGVLEFWNVQAAAVVARFKIAETPILGMVISGDDSIIVTALGDGTARLIKASTGEVLRALKGHTGPVLAVSLNSASTIAATASWDGSVRLWEVASGNLVATYAPQATAVFSVALNPNNRQIALASRDSKGYLYDLEVHSGSKLSVARKDSLSFPTTVLVERSKTTVPRCLTRQERQKVFLDPQPPTWCSGKWPYSGAAR